MPIKTFSNNDVTNTTFRILNITVASWDQMHMTMKNCLPSSFSTIHANVKTVNR